MSYRASYSLSSPTAKYVAVGLCTTAVLGCSIAYWYRTRRLSLTAAAPVTAVRKAYIRSMAALSGAGAPPSAVTVLPSEYPKVRRDEKLIETLHGVEVPDPYRWLEDPDSKETQLFVADQNALTSKVLEKCETRDKFAKLMRQLYDYPRYHCPFKRGSRYYYSHNSGLQAQNVVYTQSSLDAEATVFLDPNTLSDDGTVALAGTKFSEDGSLLAYELASGGSDWHTLRLKRIDADSGATEDLDEELHHIKFSTTAWTHDNKGFFYNRYPAPSHPPEGEGDLGTETDSNLGQQLWYHTVGTPQSEDALVLEIADQPEWQTSAQVTDDGRFLLISVTVGCEPTNRLWYVDLDTLPRTGDALDFSAYDRQKGDAAKALPLIKLIDDYKAQWEVVANEGTVFTLQTNLQAPRYRLVRTDIGVPTSPSEWQDLIEQHDTHLLQWATALKGDALVVCYLQHARSKLQLHSLDSGRLQREIPLPGLGSVREFSGRRRDAEAFFLYTDFAVPGAIYRIGTSEADVEPKLFREGKLKADFSPDQLETRQMFVTSKDGTRVPMFVVCRKGTQLDGTNPTLLYGYGGFNISLEPTFSVARLCFILAYNGVFAMANLRGGGEYGISWREAGSLHNKQNVFDDFAACAEHLIASRYTSAGKLIIHGGSNGGLLVAACTNQRPDLFACGIDQVGVHDMLRFHKFTIGHAWMTDYGNPDKKADFDYLMTYSPCITFGRQEMASSTLPSF